MYVVKGRVPPLWVGVLVSLVHSGSLLEGRHAFGWGGGSEVSQGPGNRPGRTFSRVLQRQIKKNMFACRTQTVDTGNRSGVSDGHLFCP